MMYMYDTAAVSVQATPTAGCKDIHPLGRITKMALIFFPNFARI